jgi:hypothetical protein
MARLYTAQFNGVAVTAQQDFFELVAPSTGAVLVHAIELSQTTEVGDAQEEGLLILLKSGQTTSGSGGSTPTPVPLAFGDAASGSAVEANNTTKAADGTIVTHAAWAWNVRGDFMKIFTPEMRPLVRASRRMTVELATTPDDSITMSGTLWFEELS